MGFDVALKNSESKNSPSRETIIRTVPKGSILQVIEDRKEADFSSQLILKVCHLPEIPPSSEEQQLNHLQEGELGSIETEELEKKNLKNTPTYPHLSAKCDKNTSISDSLSK